MVHKYSLHPVLNHAMITYVTISTEFEKEIEKLLKQILNVMRNRVD